MVVRAFSRIYHVAESLLLERKHVNLQLRYGLDLATVASSTKDQGSTGNEKLMRFALGQTWPLAVA